MCFSALSAALLHRARLCIRIRYCQHPPVRIGGPAADGSLAKCVVRVLNTHGTLQRHLCRLPRAPYVLCATAATAPRTSCLAMFAVKLLACGAALLVVLCWIHLCSTAACICVKSNHKVKWPPHDIHGQHKRQCKKQHHEKQCVASGRFTGTRLWVKVRICVRYAQCRRTLLARGIVKKQQHSDAAAKAVALRHCAFS